MSSVSISLNSAEFRKAMAEYAAVCKKDSAYAVNRTLNNFMVQGNQLTKIDRKSAIQAIAQESWWPKIVAKVIGKAAGKEAASKIFQAQWASAKKMERQQQLGKKQKAFKLDKEERSYAKLAKATSKKLISGRLNAVRFLSFFFAVCSQKLVGYIPGSRMATSGKSFAGFAVSVKPAVTNNLTAMAQATYKYKRRSSAEGLEKKLREAISAAIPVTIRDMNKYIADKLSKRASQYSGRK